MTLDRRLRELSRAVLRGGGPEEALELLRLTERLRPEDAAVQLKGYPARALLAAWSAAPGERGLAARLLPLLGWEVVPREEREPGSWWEEHGRRGTSGDHDYDTVTGLPLYVRVRRTGAILARVPAGQLSREHAAELELDGVGDARVDAGFWLGIRELTIGEYLEITGPDGLPGAPYTNREPGSPVRSVSWLEAMRYCRDLDAFDGGPVPVVYRLPRVLEWELALELGGQWGRPVEPGEAVLLEEEYRSHPALEPGRRPNALGLEDMIGNVAELGLERSGAAPRRLRSWRCDQPRLPDDVVCDLEDLRHVASFLFAPRGEHPYPHNLARITEQFGEDVADHFRQLLRSSPHVPAMGASYRWTPDLATRLLRQLESIGNAAGHLGFRLAAAPASCLDCPVHG